MTLLPNREPRISLEPRLQAALGDAYRLLKELGGGGMSRVFLAEETRLGRQVVIKVLPPEMGAAVNVERFEREIQLAARLQHPHVVPLLTTAGRGDLLFYIMPFIAGESLRAKLAREGELPVAEAVKILREVVDALSYAHRNGVVHRDIKPDNVLLSDGHAVVTDFGVAKAVTASSGESSLTSLGVALGTPAYMAPEQAAADPHVDHRADIYAVGALAYEMLTGRTPFTAPTAQALLAAHITQPAEPVAKHRPAVSATLNALIMRCLEKRAADRWQTAGELLSQLEVVVTPSGGMTPTGTTPVVSTGTEKAIRLAHPIRVALLFGAASAGVLALVYLLVSQLGLPDWVFYGAVALLVIGLPIMMVTGHLERRRALARATGRVVPTPIGGLQKLFTWRKAIQGGVIAFALLGIGTALFTAMRLLGIGPVGTLVASGMLSERDQLVVAEFENKTTDPSLGSSVTEAFRIDLAQSPVVRLVGTAQVSEALTRMQRDPNSPISTDLAREVAAREGVKAVVAGEISAVGRSYVIVARIVDATDGTELVALRETAADDAEILAAIDRLSGRLRERIGESLRSIRAGEPLEQVTTGSLEALRLYSEGSRLSDRGDSDRAVPLLEQAIGLDSGFAMAWRKLAVALSNAEADRSRVVAAATRAYQLRDRLPETERQFTVAYYHAEVDYDPARVEAAYRRIRAANPDNFAATNNLALLLTYEGRYAEAESLAAPAVQVAERVGNMHIQLLTAQLGQGHPEAATATIRRMASLEPTSPLYLWSRAFGYAAMQQYDSAQQAYVEMGLKLRDPSQQARAVAGLVDVAQTRGHLAEAGRQRRLLGEINERRGLPGQALAAATQDALAQLRLRGDTAGALSALRAALARYPLESIPPLDRPATWIATVYAHAGQAAEARRLLAAYESSVPAGIPRGDFTWHAARGWLALAEGRPADAVTAFQDMRGTPDCGACSDWALAIAFERAGEPDSALAAHTRAVAPGTGWKIRGDVWGLAPSLKRLGEFHEERGERQRAAEYYGRFVSLWADADPALQPTVREVKARLTKLAGER